MKVTKILLATSALTALAGAVSAEGHMANDMTVVSWGGAYQASQTNAYTEPYKAMHEGLNVIWDESSAEAVAKLRAMNEAGNITWDLVDVEAADAIRLCDEGLAMEIDPDTMLAPGADGSTASEDFGDSLISDCFIPQIVFSTTVGYRTDMVGATPPTDICALFDTATYPGKRSLNKRPLANMEWALAILRGIGYGLFLGMMSFGPAFFALIQVGMQGGKKAGWRMFLQPAFLSNFSVPNLLWLHGRQLLRLWLLQLLSVYRAYLVDSAFAEVVLLHLINFLVFSLP